MIADALRLDVERYAATMPSTNPLYVRALEGTLTSVHIAWYLANVKKLLSVSVPHLERAVAAWLHYLLTERSDAGSALAISDPGAAALTERMRSSQNRSELARAALAHTSVFGEAPWPDAFIARLCEHLIVLRGGGVGAL